MVTMERAIGDFGFNKVFSKRNKCSNVDTRLPSAPGTSSSCFSAVTASDVMSNNEAGQYVKELVVGKYAGEPISIINERLLDKCLEKGSRDNMTGAMILFPALTAGENVKPQAVIDAENAAKMQREEEKMAAEKRAAEKRAEAHREAWRHTFN